ncbi:hypothetical protein PP641_gp023 [Arthrobacter phage SilentRX]|uniref:Uncharacterized protein n=1 Tax=Arthrobacter phage SilentRX TaxID=2836091 RepID=A0A8F3IPN6_9CAUD|nr:hypothetical protein PP641_gp023 [Arthrobacter phage SilentRX]QWY82764.1 hypothetical protein SEA_SILENTRX_23 [Arthrobacter phage SilentRX]
MSIPKLAESETYVKGKSTATVQKLIDAVGAENVRSTSFGYIVTGEFDAEGLTTFTAEDRPAVHTEPGTSTNPDEVNNVGQAATAVADAKTAEAEAAAEGTDAGEGEGEGDAGDGAEESKSAADKDAEGKAEQFDPTEATIAEVKEYLDGADDTERERVLAAEAEGKGRKGILDLADTEGAK